MSRPPADTDARRIGSRARAIVHYRLDAACWDYREDAGGDGGRDCVAELAEGGRWRGHRVEAVVKGTRSPRLSSDGSYYSIAVEARTIERALAAPDAFVVFLVDVAAERVWFACIQDCFIENPRLFARLRGRKSLTLRVPAEAELPEREAGLRALAATAYADGPGPSLKRYAPDDPAAKDAPRGAGTRQGRLF